MFAGAYTVMLIVFPTLPEALFDDEALDPAVATSDIACERLVPCLCWLPAAACWLGAAEMPAMVMT